MLQSRVKTEPGWARWVKESSHEISTLSHLSISDFVQQVEKFSFDSEIVLSYLHSFISISRKLNLILMQLVIMNWSSVFVLNTRCPVMRHSHKYLKPLCLYPRINFFGRFLKTWFQWIAPLASNISPSSTSSSSSKRFVSTAFPALLVTVLQHLMWPF